MLYSTLVACDVGHCKPLKEKFETVYIKLVELCNIMRVKAHAKNVYFNEDTVNKKTNAPTITVRVGQGIASLLQASCSSGLEIEEDGFIGKFGNFTFYRDEDRKFGEAEIDVTSGKALLTVNNLF